MREESSEIKLIIKQVFKGEDKTDIKAAFNSKMEKVIARYLKKSGSPGGCGR